MIDTPPPPDSSSGNPDDRRRNVALRTLIDEMMSSIRTATHGNLWTTEERTQYERELATIMSRVRDQAVRKDDAG